MDSNHVKKSVMKGSGTMKREQLKELGLDAEVIDKVISIHGESMSGQKTHYESLLGEKDKAIQEANDKIASFEGIDAEALKTEIADWKTKAEEAITKNAEIETKFKVDSALDAKLYEEKAKNITAVKALLPMDKITVSEEGNLIIKDGDKIEKFDDVFAPIKEKNDYMFGEATTTTTARGGGNFGNGKHRETTQEDEGSNEKMNAWIRGEKSL